MQIAILTNSRPRSPKILAYALEKHLNVLGINTKVYCNIEVLNSQVRYADSNYNLHFWLRERLTNLKKYWRLKRDLHQYDAIIISECIPNAFWKKLYNVEKLKKALKKPILLYEVYYLGNAPTQQLTLAQNGDYGLNRFDYHFSVAQITETKATPSPQWFPVGIYAKSWELKPLLKKDFFAVVDFLQPGFENYRRMQIQVLEKLNISFIALEHQYSISEIRRVYERGVIYFVQWPEAFGLPILECLCCGNQIFTPSASWPMSWRLDYTSEANTATTLPSCFTVYNDEEDLTCQLLAFKSSYHYADTPKKIFDVFEQHYPDYYHGNDAVLQDALKAIEKWPKNA